MQKILIADDDVRMCRAIGEILAGPDMAICEAHSGAEAVDLYITERPDWVIMDLRMKPVDGLRATTQIKAYSPEARVVIVSQYDDTELRKAAALVGAYAYVLKEDLHELPGILTGRSPGTPAASAIPAKSRTGENQR